MFNRLRKLRGKSFDEIADRARQQTNRLAERLRLSSQVRLPTNRELFARLNVNGASLGPEGLQSHWRSRCVPFYPSFEDPQSTIRTFRDRFPEEVQVIVGKADRIRDGEFDLLGYRRLRFGGRIPDWHLDPIREKRSLRVHWSAIDEIDPELTGDKKIIWELNRHQYFSTLGRAYWLTGAEVYAETFACHVQDWMVNNPPKVGVNWLSSLEVAFRSISWIWAISFFVGSPSLTPELLVRMLKFLYLNGRHLETYLSTYFSPNTHLTGEALGLYLLGTFLPELDDAPRWKQLGYRTMVGALDYQVRPDGVYCEQASHYQRYTADFYLNLLALQRTEGLDVDPVIEEKLHLLLDFLLTIQQPDGETPLFGDDDGGRLYFLDERPISDMRPTLALGATLLERGDLKFLSAGAGPELLWLLGPQGLVKFDSIDSVEPKTGAKAFESGGFFVYRSERGPHSDHLLIDCGPHGFLNGGHAHADALAFVLSVGGVPVFIDSGTYNYTSEPDERNRFRSGSAHNCLTVDGKSSSEPDGPFSWRSVASSTSIEWSETRGGVRFLGTHDGFAHLDVRYRRRIEAEGESFLIEDILESNGYRNFEVNFVLAAGIKCTIDQIDRTALLHRADGEPIVRIDGDVVGQEGITGTWRTESTFASVCYGSRFKTFRLVFGVPASGRFTIRSRIIKYPEKR